MNETKIITWDDVNGVTVVPSLSHVDFCGDSCEMTPEESVLSSLKDGGFGFAEISQDLFEKIELEYGITK